MKTLIFALFLGFQAFAAKVDLNSSDYYQRLGLEKGATQEEIKSAFRTLAMTYHPDNKLTGNTQSMQKLNEAYDNLQRNITHSYQNSGYSKPPPPQPPTSSSESASLNPKETMVYKKLMSELKAKIHMNQYKQMGFDPFENPVTAFYYAVSDVADWLQNGEDPTDSIESIGRGGYSQLKKIEKMAVADFFDETVRQNMPAATRPDIEMLLKQSRLELLMSLIDKNYQGGEHYFLIRDLLTSLKKVPSGNRDDLVTAFNSLVRMSADPNLRTNGVFKLVASGVDELFEFYNRLQEVKRCDEYL